MGLPRYFSHAILSRDRATPSLCRRGGSRWRDVGGQKRSPAQPAGGQYNDVRFKPVTAAKARVVFTHAGKSRSGVTEMFVWAD